MDGGHFPRLLVVLARIPFSVLGFLALTIFVFGIVVEIALLHFMCLVLIIPVIMFLAIVWDDVELWRDHWQRFHGCLTLYGVLDLYGDLFRWALVRKQS